MTMNDINQDDQDENVSENEGQNNARNNVQNQQPGQWPNLGPNQQHITFRGNASGNADEAEVILPLPWENLQPGERTVQIDLNRVRNRMRISVRRHRRRRRSNALGNSSSNGQ